MRTIPCGSRFGRPRDEMVLQELDVVDPLHEGKADEVGVLGDEVEVAEILRGQRRQVELGRGEIDALARLEPHALLARGVDLDLRSACAFRHDPRRRLAVVDEHFRADGELVDEFREVEREGDRLLRLFPQLVDNDDPVAALEASLRRRLDLRMRHFGPAMSIRILHGRSSRPPASRTLAIMRLPGLGVVMGAIDAGAVHAGGDQIVDEFGLGRGLRRAGSP